MNSVISLVVVAVLASTVHAIFDQSKFGPKLQELAKNLGSTCRSKSGTDQASIDKVINGEFIDEPKIKVYMRCLFTESGVITEKGLNLELVAQLLPPEITDESVKNAKICLGKIKGITNVEERAFNFFKCYYSQNSDLFVFF